MQNGGRRCLYGKERVILIPRSGNMKQASRNRRKRTRTLALTLALFCLSIVLSGLARTASAADEGYGRVTDDNVKVRKAASTSSNWWFKLPKGWVSEVLGTSKREGITWYKVKTHGPTQGTRTYIGYIHGDFFQPMTDAELEDWLKNPIQPGAGMTGTVGTPTIKPNGVSGSMPTPIPDTVYGYVRLLDDGINLRRSPAGSVITRIDGRPVLAYLAEPRQDGRFTWYYVKIPGGVYGYLRSDVVKSTNEDGKIGQTPSQVPGSPPGAGSFGYIKMTADKVNLRKTPNGSRLCWVSLGEILPLTAQPKNSGAYTWYPVLSSSGLNGYLRGDMAAICDQNGTTTAPAAPSVPTPVDAAGYVMVNMKSVNLRKSIGGVTIMSLDKGTVWPMVSAAVKNGSYTWYPVDVNDTKGFLRGDASYQLSDFQAESYLKGEGVPAPSPSPTPTPGPSNYLITVLDKVNLRSSASKDASAPYNVALSTVMKHSGSSTSGGSLWYKAVYKDTNVWVLGSCVKAMNTKEYSEWLAAQPTPAPTPATKPEDLSDMAETTMDSVLVRADGNSNGRQVSKIYQKGSVVTLTGKTNTDKGYTWYGVKLQSGTEGYIRCDLLRIYTKDEKKQYEDNNNHSGNGGKQETVYETLRKGSSGEAVKKLQAELKTQGYFSGSINGTYGTDTVNAVRSFQNAKRLTVDGIAGPLTQHTLFGTVSVGSSDVVLTNTIYAAEKIDWWTGGINTIWKRGMNVRITDVKTGITFWAHRWAGANHVDAEPLTAADTKRICNIYGVSSAQEIAGKNLYQRRALWVTIGTHTYCASMYGVPHNYPDGDTIANNDYKGQFCVHFTNSKTHTSNRVDPTHTETIQYAYDTFYDHHSSTFVISPY